MANQPVGRAVAERTDPERLRRVFAEYRLAVQLDHIQAFYGVSREELLAYARSKLTGGKE